MIARNINVGEATRKKIFLRTAITDYVNRQGFMRDSGR